MDRTVERRAWFVFAAIASVAAVAISVFLSGGLRNVTYELRTAEAVSGLLPGAPVEFHGVEVGRVGEVRLIDPQTVQVLLRIHREAPVTTATVATITGRGMAARGFTGYVFVSLEDTMPGGVALATVPGEPYQRIATAPAQSSSLDTAVTQLNANMQLVVSLLQQTLDVRTVGALKATVDNLEQVSGTLAANDTKLRGIIANTERASARLAPLLQSGGQAVDTLQQRVLPQAQDALAHFDAAATAAGSAARNAETASRDFEPLVQSGARVMHSVETQVLPQTVQDLQLTDSMLTNLNRAATQVRDNPSTLIWGSRVSRRSTGAPN